MIDKPLKEKIAKLYSATTKVSIFLAVISIIIAVIMKFVPASGNKADFYLSYGAVLLLTVTPFIGIVLAVMHYVAEKNRKMLLSSLAILAVLIIGIALKI